MGLDINIFNRLLELYIQKQYIVSTLGMLMIISNILFFIFTIIYICIDSKKRNMDTLIWILINIFVPHYIGFVTYVVVTHFNSNKVDEDKVLSKQEKKYINKKVKIIYIVVTILAIIILVISMYFIINKEYYINESNKYITSNDKNGGKIIKSSNSFEHKYKDFNKSEETEIRYEKDGNLKIEYSSKIKRGFLEMGIYEYSGKPIKIFKINENKTIIVPIKKNTIYRIIATGKNTKGYYKLNWNLK